MPRRGEASQPEAERARWLASTVRRGGCMRDHDRGQLDTSGAEVYASLFVPALFGRFAGPVADAAGIGPLDAVIDVACGTGVLTGEVRDRTSGTVIGVDVNPAMVAVARRMRGDVDFVEGDAADLPFGDGAFDAAVSQFGLMFMDDPSAAVLEMARVARRGLVAVWAGIEHSDGYSALQELFRSELGDDAAASLDAPFGMGRAGVLESVFQPAGIADVELLEIQGTARFASIAQWVTTEVRGWTLGDSVSDLRLVELIAVAEDRLGDFEGDEGVVFEMAALAARWGR